MIAFMFPGQGAQQVGMGRALAEQFPEARAVFEEADGAFIDADRPSVARRLVGAAAAGGAY